MKELGQWGCILVSCILSQVPVCPGHHEVRRFCHKSPSPSWCLLAGPDTASNHQLRAKMVFSPFKLFPQITLVIGTHSQLRYKRLSVYHITPDFLALLSERPCLLSIVLVVYQRFPIYSPYPGLTSWPPCLPYSSRLTCWTVQTSLTACTLTNPHSRLRFQHH